VNEATKLAPSVADPRDMPLPLQPVTNLLLFYDAETSGMVDWKNPSEGEQQPHIVELYAALHDPVSGECIHELHELVKPDGWVIPDDVIAIHGITNERAAAEGLPEADVLASFLDLHSSCAKRIGHNESFDARIMRIALKRYRNDEEAEAFKAAPAFCTMHATTDLCKVPGKFRGKYKWPKLTEAYKHFFGEELADAHQAMADGRATARLYFHLRSIGAIA